ncbi:hypothetical protein WMY93_026637 [Mugilogobius chulae]|uniref:Ig-like domain-containing protein n=1 Tax=Mugilogobius chulae TaxID=88201 RepID=A0AAW0N2Z4_9GOBI
MNRKKREREAQFIPKPTDDITSQSSLPRAVGRSDARALSLSQLSKSRNCTCFGAVHYYSHCCSEKEPLLYSPVRADCRNLTRFQPHNSDLEIRRSRCKFVSSKERGDSPPESGTMKGPIRQFWFGTGKMNALVCLLVFASVYGASGQTVKVDPEVSSYPGQTVNLRCSFNGPSDVQLTMVTWIYEPKEGDRTNIAVVHPTYGPTFPESPLKGRVTFLPSPPTMQSPSIQISDIRMTDEGKYICEYASYPTGNQQGITQLVMLAKPQNTASILTVDAGTKKMVVARCESLNGRPEAKIRWVTAVNGNATSVSKAGADNTMSVISEYSLVPTPADNGKDISCVVDHRTQDKPDSFPLKLAVQYAPQVSIKGYDNNWYVGRTNVELKCEAHGNPVPTLVTWRAMSGEMPDTVEVRENTLKVLKVDEAVNTTFVCEVKNRIGVGKSQVTVFVRGVPLPQRAPLPAASSAPLSEYHCIGHHRNSHRHVPQTPQQTPRRRSPNYKPPPPNKTNSTASRQVTNIRQAPEERPLQNEYTYTHTQSPEPSTNLDHFDDENMEEGPDPYSPAVPPVWDDRQNAPLPYMETHGEEDYTPAPSVDRGDSFISAP